MASVNSEQDFSGWLPIRAWLQNGEWRLDWCWFGEQRLTRPFFRDDVDHALRLPFNQAFRRETDLQALLDWQAVSPGLPPTALIFHASRCGSTLMAQMLATLDDNIVLSEPPPLDNLLRAHRLDPKATLHQPAWLAALVSAYGQRRQGNEQRLFIKLDAWNVFEAPLLLALYPEVPRVFLYRDPLEIVVSQLRQPGMHRVPGLLGPSALDLPTQEALRMTPAEYTSRTVGAILRQGLALCQQHGAVAVNYQELPDACWGRLASLFDVHDAHLPRLRETAGFDAKQPSQSFTADSQSKREAADEGLRETVEYWAGKAYRALEQWRMTKQEHESSSRS
ncbi:sulfotransferase [Pseudomonas chengduensis]|nr:sulfotransferase family protein [Pseudomonas chengduensis]MDH1210081.1 sulfotransferase [Pseudomonas chengduensis]MDH1279621.1 sulfotransferase [Pseudomonas chengduensis]MDH1681776.1 sulfotransferase [Pseudomonas chengduensis]